MNGITALVAQMRDSKARKLSGKALQDEIIRLSAHMSQRTIARELDISRTYVFDVLRAARSGDWRPEAAEPSEIKP